MSYRCDHGHKDGNGCPICNPPDYEALQSRIEKLEAISKELYKLLDSCWQPCWDDLHKLMKS